jgi:hypothetical protein
MVPPFRFIQVPTCKQPADWLQTGPRLQYGAAAALGSWVPIIRAATAPSQPAALVTSAGTQGRNQQGLEDIGIGNCMQQQIKSQLTCSKQDPRLQ